MHKIHYYYYYCCFPNNIINVLWFIRIFKPHRVCVRVRIWICTTSLHVSFDLVCTPFVCVCLCFSFIRWRCRALVRQIHTHIEQYGYNGVQCILYVYLVHVPLPQISLAIIFTILCQWNSHPNALQLRNSATHFHVWFFFAAAAACSEKVLSMFSGVCVCTVCWGSFFAAYIVIKQFYQKFADYSYLCICIGRLVCPFPKSIKSRNLCWTWFVALLCGSQLCMCLIGAAWIIS